MSGYYFLKYFILLSEDLLASTNSADLDEMQHDAAFHPGLHCLQNYSFRGFLNPKSKYTFYSVLVVWFPPLDLPI